MPGRALPEIASSALDAVVGGKLDPNPTPQSPWGELCSAYAAAAVAHQDVAAAVRDGLASRTDWSKQVVDNFTEGATSYQESGDVLAEARDVVCRIAGSSERRRR